MDARLKEIIDESQNIVFFGGAGVSTESNIPDFRSEQGLYHAKQAYGYAPEEILSHTFFMRHTETFFDYYKHNLIYPDARPNKAHLALAYLERQGDCYAEYRRPAPKSRQQKGLRAARLGSEKLLHGLRGSL